MATGWARAAAGICQGITVIEQLSVTLRGVFQALPAARSAGSWLCSKMGWRAAACSQSHTAAPHRAAVWLRWWQQGLCRAALGLWVEGPSHAGVHSTRPATARPQEQTHGSQSSRGSTEVVPSSLRPSSVPPPQQEHPTAASTAPCPPDSSTNRLEAPGPHRSPAPRQGPAASSLVQGLTPQTGTPPSRFPLLPGQLSEHSQSSTSGPGPHSSCKSSTVRNPGELWLQAARVPQEMSTPQSLHLCRAAASPALKSHTPTWDAS